MVSSQTVGRAWCPTDRRWMAVVPSPLRWHDHLAHLIIALVTFGLWLPWWLLRWGRAQQPVCATCGTRISDTPVPIPPDDLRRVHRLGQNVARGER
ncbi:MAG: hypothetical protein AVDCRST_MAG45-833 [uncultured Solirubrobacterales bacterium]|uniref:Uncharacterized protein n=1 Tax=uncultured Solirubrobacterales bacterium TaxID=768556 RepID=A0A6J4S8M7_9ACTN|nr:MAG: hypothetical protein AVDCRST_MAG45-833 [uncultured Solirubrobacterales bacterium]